MVKLSIYYLNWDDTNKEGLTRGRILGEVYDFNIYNYRHIDTFELDGIDNVDDVLNDIYYGFNSGRQLNNRSMCVGDLIMIDNKRYIVKLLGFELVA